MEHDGTMYGVDLIRHSSQGVRGDFFQVLQSYTGANHSNSFSQVNCLMMKSSPSQIHKNGASGFFLLPESRSYRSS